MKRFSFVGILAIVGLLTLPHQLRMRSPWASQAITVNNVSGNGRHRRGAIFCRRHGRKAGGQALFTSRTQDPVASSITDVYFDDGTLSWAVVGHNYGSPGS